MTSDIFSGVHDDVYRDDPAPGPVSHTGRGGSGGSHQTIPVCPGQCTAGMRPFRKDRGQSCDPIKTMFFNSLPVFLVH